MHAIEKVGGLVFKIPPRSPHLNPIENFFHSLTVRLNNDAIKKQITRENYIELSTRVKETQGRRERGGVGGCGTPPIIFVSQSSRQIASLPVGNFSAMDI